MLNRIKGLVQRFFAETASPADILYNEASLQHELALFLRPRLVDGERLYIERPAATFRKSNAKLVKKEIDLAITDETGKSVVAIELKCPRQGQHPEQMFKACQDIEFLEQLVAIGFSGGLFLMHVRDRPFYESGSRDGIYAHFRSSAPLGGTIQKPTGARDLVAQLRGTYTVGWRSDRGDGKYWLQSVSAAEPAVAAHAWPDIGSTGSSSAAPHR